MQLKSHRGELIRCSIDMKRKITWLYHQRETKTETKEQKYESQKLNDPVVIFPIIRDV